jgi:hypothetical protein
MGGTRGGLGPNLGGDLDGAPNGIEGHCIYGATEGRFKWARGY